MSRSLEGRFICLGVTGSIAAYKAAELVRMLTAEGADVQVLMTPTAARFIGPLTLETLSRRRVMLDPLELLPDRRIGHIVAADAADAIVVAPATARWLGAMANGLADDVVTATCLASVAPVVVAPAMDGEMYAHPATKANVKRLQSFGYAIVEPEHGPLASGQVGQGRLAAAGDILAAVRKGVGDRPVRASDASLRPPRQNADATGDLDGWTVLVTAGGTAEPIDPVRYIGNRSSGRMGVAIAEAALGRGARVVLIHGLTSIPLPEAAELIHAPTAEAMREAVLARITQSDLLVMAAAVADFRPRLTASSKVSRDSAPVLELEPTADILAEAAALARSQARPPTLGVEPPRRAIGRPILVGFAAETGGLARVPEKAARKGVDMMVANDVSAEGSGFGTETNQVTLVVPGSEPKAWPLLSKRQVAERLLDEVLAYNAAAGASSEPRSHTPAEVTR